MRSPAQAIAWEICAKNRWALLLAFGLIPFCAVLWLVVPPGHEAVKVIQVFSSVATFASLIWVASYTATDARGSFSGFPSWMYTLPMSTAALVLCPMLLGASLMLVATVGWELTVCFCWEAPFRLRYLAWHIVLTTGSLLSVQALIWSLHRFRWIRVVALVAAFYGFLYVALVGHVWNFSGGLVLWLGGVSLTLPLAVAGGIAGVERDRRGRWEGWTGKLLERVLDLIPRRSRAFRSAARARLWFEWRRKGLFAGVAFGVTMALWVFTYPLSAALYLGPVETLLNFSGPFVGMVVLAGIVGSVLGKSDAWSQVVALHPIAATRPSSTADIVFAKMKAAAAVTGLGWILFTILLAPVVAISSRLDWPSEQALRFWQDFSTNYPKFWRWLTNPVVILALLAATWHTIVQTMAVILTGNRRHIYRRTWQGMAVLVAVSCAVVWLVKHPSHVDAFLRSLPWFMAAIMVLKIYGTVRGFVAVRALLATRDFLILAGLWILVATLVLGAGFLAQSPDGLPGAILWTLVLWQFFPAGEIPVCVAALASNRHR